MITAKKKYRFNPDYAVPPGQTLLDVINEKGISQRELAARTDLTVQTISRIISGEQPISYETANRLELVTGVPARMWNNLESFYREQLQKIAEKERRDEEIAWLKQIPVNELIQRGILPDTADKAELAHETLRFYGVCNVNAYREIWESPKVAARRSLCFETRIGPASAWIRLGELQASKIECQPFNRKQFENALQQIRSLSSQSPEKFIPVMRNLCADSGVALALVKEMPKVPWNGVTKWLSPNKALIILNLRGKGEDKFWFSFFHEAYHVLHPIKKNLLINSNDKNDPEEVKADGFSAEFLIPEQYNKQILDNPGIASFKRIASELGIAMGIVVGRYQHLTGDWKKYSRNIRKFSWSHHP